MRSIFKRTNTWMAALLAITMLVAGCGMLNDVDFARTLMTRLVKGLYLARPMIDWGSLKVMEKDIGVVYRTIPNKDGQDVFQRLFIDSFKKGFQSTQAQMEIFKGWRSLRSSNPKIGVVVVEMPASKMFLLLVLDKSSGRTLLKEIKAARIDNSVAWGSFEKEYGLEVSTEK